MKAQEIAEALMDRGVAFEVSRGSGVTHYAPTNGFYKSDGMAYLVDEPGGDTVLHARYQSRNVVTSPEDVIRESKQWHEYSEDRGEGWRVPPTVWQALYDELTPSAT